MGRMPRMWIAGAVLLLLAGARSYGQAREFRALSGAAAAAFVVPADMERVQTLYLAAQGFTYERYQQYFGPQRARVLNGQITILRDASGVNATVIGSHYPEIAPRNAVRIGAGEARGVADRDIGPSGERRVELSIQPETGRYLFRVETRRFASRWVHWVDAETGGLLRKYDALATDHGIGLGVKGDVKDIATPKITTSHGSSGHGASGAHWDLISQDNRQITYDARNRTSLLYYVTDTDNDWTQTGRTSPGHPALIDAQYYANVADDYFTGRHGFNWTACYAAGMQSVAHYSRNYNNAFWNGTYLVYGDGDGSLFRELSGGLDVVAHESTHGVTDCTSNLIYQDESGALNESFSDILGNSSEFFAADLNLEPHPDVTPDWWIGEDVYLPADDVSGFRNMADPAEDGDPDHYSERQIGGGDNGGVHTNSGIPNHAFYLLIQGGRNAGCDTVGSNGHTHAADCDVVVTGIGLLDAERIFFQGFTALPEGATMCEARAATEAAASLFGSTQLASTTAAWRAVGLGNGVCGGGSEDAAPTIDLISPAEGATVSGVTAIQIDAADAEDPSGSLVVEWNVDGGDWQPANYDAGTGYYEASWNTESVSSGNHTLNARATDSAGNVVSDAHNVTVDNEEEPPAEGMHVGDLDGSSLSQGSTWTATVTILVHDVDHNPVASANVSGSWSGGFSGSAACTTDANGRCSVSTGGIRKRDGSVTFTAGDITHATLAYASADNHDPDGDSDGITITVSKP